MAEFSLSLLTRLPGQIRQARLHEEKLASGNKHLQDALVQNKIEGHKLAVYARWIALAVIAILIPFLNFSPSVIYYEVILLGFAFLGWAQLKVARVGQNQRELVLIFADLALMTFVILVPNPFYDLGWPIALQYRFDNFLYFFVLLAGATLAYSWRTIIAISTWTAALWIFGLLITMFFGRQIPGLSEKISIATANYPLMSELMDPNSVLPGFRIQEIVVFFIVAGILALNGWRNSQLLLKQADVARQRANLARHFPPNIVDQMADQDEPLGQIRAQNVAVMFADIVGFTKMAEKQNPEYVVKLLREYHRVMEKSVFDNNGTLDKFLGDGIMATFGTPRTGPDDAANALQCASDMLEAIDQWNTKRKELAEPPIKLSIGIHFGEVILGDVGSSRRLEFATLGDTVNVASRLEELTRNLDTQLVVSNELIDAVEPTKRQESGDLRINLKSVGNKLLRGRTRETGIWTLKQFPIT